MKIDIVSNKIFLEVSKSGNTFNELNDEIVNSVMPQLFTGDLFSGSEIKYFNFLNNKWEVNNGKESLKSFLLMHGISEKERIRIEKY